MSKAYLGRFRQLLALVGRDNAETGGEPQLLERFVRSGDEEAFRALLEHHGPMVLGVCQRILHEADDVEDAFQATFLVLARKAAALDARRPLASWLHTVARNIALKMRRAAGRRTIHERKASSDAMIRAPQDTELAWQELKTLLDTELARLPERLRAPLILCHLQGKTHEQAARELGVPSGSLWKRLNRGGDLLRTRLSRHGLTLSSAALATILTQKGSASVPASLLARTARAIGNGGQGTAVELSPRARACADEAIRSMSDIRLRVTAVVLAVLAAAGGLALFHASVERPEAPPLLAERNSVARIDPLLEPLPEGAIARFGSDRLRHRGPVHAVAFSPDGKALASAGGSPFDNDFTIRLWDRDSGRELRQFRGHQGSVKSLAFTPDGEMLASSSEDDSVRLWNVATGAAIHTFTPGKKPITAAAMSHDGSLLAALDSDGIIYVWDIQTRKEMKRLSGASGQIAFLPDGRQLASAARGGDIVLWDLTHEGRHRHLEAASHSGPVSSLTVSPNGKLVAALSVQPALASGTITVWDIDKGEAVRSFNHRNDSFPSIAFSSLSFSPDSRRLAAGAGDHSIRVWDLASGRQLHRLDAHQGYALSLCFARDGDTLASGGGDETVRLWNVSTGAEAQPFVGHQRPVVALAFSTDSKLVFSGARDGTVCRWTTDGQLEQRFRACREALHSLALSADGRLLVTTGLEDRTLGFDQVVCWDPTTGKQLGRLKDENSLFGSPILLVCSLDGRLLATSAMEGVCLWDIRSRKKVGAVGDNALSLGRLVAFAPDGKLVALADETGIGLWNVVTGKEVRRMALESGHAVRALSFSPDGRWLASTACDKVVKLWDVASGKELRALTHDHEVTALAFAPAGTTVAAGTKEGNVHLWDAATGNHIHRFTGHTDRVAALVFTRDGTRLASACNRILIWDVSGQQGR